jgi:hypothetical protein
MSSADDKLILSLQEDAKRGASSKELIHLIEAAYPGPSASVAVVRFFHKAFGVNMQQLSIVPSLLAANGWDYRRLDQEIMPEIWKKSAATVHG